MTILPDREAQSTLLLQRVHDYHLRGKVESKFGKLGREGFQIEIADVKTKIDKYSDEFINLLCELTAEESAIAHKLLNNVYYESANPEYYDFQRDNLSTSKSSPIYINEALGGLLHYTRASPVGHSTNHGPLTTEQVTALATVTARLQDAKHATSEQDTHDLFSNHDYARWIPVTLMLSNTVITDSSLAQLIIEHPGQAERIANTILDRQIVDTELLRSIITTEAFSLSEGIV